MAERMSGLHRSVTMPAQYEAVQRLVGYDRGSRSMASIVVEWLGGKPAAEIDRVRDGWVRRLKHLSGHRGIADLWTDPMRVPRFDRLLRAAKLRSACHSGVETRP
ncbi:hypothetical protein [Salinarimonas rosea]|uniref:hypothetical protein n=1 Tax=Salinarimonas rosea TaxID=552063 RepID=UPI000401C922|nr:hypothetical protein [Salinarimonas rosea]